jgi:pyridoxamine 5'-phosphate oxidase family protein
MTVFTERELAYLRGQPLGRLATVQPGGTVQNNPVGFHWNPELDTVDVGGHGLAASRKFRNIAAGSPVSLVVDDVESFDPFAVRCLEIRGRAEALTGPEIPGGAVIRIHPHRILSFNIDPDNPDAGRRDT